MVVVSMALLFSWTGSVFLVAEIPATLIKEPPPLRYRSRTNVNVAEVPLAMEGLVQLTVKPPGGGPVQAQPAGGVIEPNVPLGGRESRSSSPCTSSGPPLVTTIVYVTC